ncbi:MAG: hypothetical protein ACYC8T_36310 [Myxococcaceae bacterium]
MRSWWTPVGIVAALAFAGCIVEAPSGQKANPEKARAVVAQAPPATVQNGANLEGKIEIVGATLTPGRVMTGESVKVAVFFKVLDTIDQDLTVFVHADDADGRTDRVNADHKPAGGSYPTNQWKKGETVKDEFSLYVPPGMPVRGLNLYIGFWDPKTDARLKLMNPDAVRSDGNNRILVAQIPVGS